MNNNAKFKRLDYIELINQYFPNTLFQYTYTENDELKWSKKKTYHELDLFKVIKKDNFYRSNLWNKESDEIRLDFDYESINKNVEVMREVISQLTSRHIDKLETYLSGGKGTHLTFRYDFAIFRNYSREDVRNKLIEVLGISCEIDKSLFQTIQVIGLEGFKHRKTNNEKKRIKINNKSYTIIENNLNFDYLRNEYINKLDNEFKLEILKELTSEIKKEITIDLKQTNYSNEKVKMHIKRFNEIYIEISDGKKRVLDMLIRYLYLTTKDINLTSQIFSKFVDNIGITLNIESKVKASIKSMKSNAIFIYKDILTKEEFYRGWIK